jgi:Ala-tRNA(Pro) deacylase
MALNARLKALFDEERASYSLVPHHEMFTAQEVAAAGHVPGREVAKVVVFRDAGGDDLMVVVPATVRVDPASVEHATGRSGLRLATEAELERLFPDCEVGAMPPFGSLYELRVYLDPCLEKDRKLYFQAGNHRELVEMDLAEYRRLAHPVTGRPCVHRRLSARRSA